MAVTPHPPYQDLLRAVGHLLDRDGWRDVSLAEDPVGLIVRGTRPDGQGRADAALSLTLGDLERLVVEARRRRGVAAPARPGATDGAGYQARLRAVGWLGQVAGLRGLRVVEEGDALRLQGRPAWAAEAGHRRVVDKRLTPADIDALLGQLRTLRMSDARAE